MNCKLNVRDLHFCIINSCLLVMSRWSGVQLILFLCVKRIPMAMSIIIAKAGQSKKPWQLVWTQASSEKSHRTVQLRVDCGTSWLDLHLTRQQYSPTDRKTHSKCRRAKSGSPRRTDEFMQKVVATSQIGGSLRQVLLIWQYTIYDDTNTGCRCFLIADQTAIHWVFGRLYTIVKLEYTCDGLSSQTRFQAPILTVVCELR